METVEVEEGLGQVYNKDTDTFNIMNKEQFAFGYEYGNIDINLRITLLVMLC